MREDSFQSLCRRSGTQGHPALVQRQSILGWRDEATPNVCLFCRSWAGRVSNHLGFNDSNQIAMLRPPRSHGLWMVRRRPVPKNDPDASAKAKLDAQHEMIDLIHPEIDCIFPGGV